jgi:redox-sensitive bicupin YhaK (pirin superfamily)
MEYADPFLLIHHHGPILFPAHNQGLPFSAHPHRGFETVTFIYEGNVVHKDSQGFSSQIDKGGVQWMSAARGIVHSENISAAMREQGGSFDIIQLWVNLPAKLKMSAPEYIGLQRNDTLEWLDEHENHFQLLSGSWNTRKGPIQSKTNITTLNVEQTAGTIIEIPAFEGQKGLLYVREGSVQLAGQSIAARGMAYFDTDQIQELCAIEASKFLLCFASPLQEPMVSHGPFVMNTTTEIMEAIRDYQMGRMGVLTD